MSNAPRRGSPEVAELERNSGADGVVRSISAARGGGGWTRERARNGAGANAPNAESADVPAVGARLSSGAVRGSSTGVVVVRRQAR